MSDPLRVYLDPAEIGPDGYPHRWHKPIVTERNEQGALVFETIAPPIKDYVRELADHRCERCGHPYRKGEHGSGEWSPCDKRCTHEGPRRWRFPHETYWQIAAGDRQPIEDSVGLEREAQWRILTVHHLNGIKHDCRWWNLAALCQRCHLRIQGRVVMDRVYPWEHSEWFQPHAAGWYAWTYLGEDLTREETLARLEELLALEAA